MDIVTVWEVRSNKPKEYSSLHYSLSMEKGDILVEWAELEMTTNNKELPIEITKCSEWIASQRMNHSIIQPSTKINPDCELLLYFASNSKVSFVMQQWMRAMHSYESHNYYYFLYLKINAWMSSPQCLFMVVITSSPSSSTTSPSSASPFEFKWNEK